MPAAANPSESLRSSLAYKIQCRRDSKDDLDAIHRILPWKYAESDRLPVKGFHEPEVPEKIGIFPAGQVVFEPPQCLRVADHPSLPPHRSLTIERRAPLLPAALPRQYTEPAPPRGKLARGVIA